MKQRVVCAGCRKETSNPYSRRGHDGVERQYCHKCAENELKKLLDRERLQEWNEWAKPTRAPIDDPDALIFDELERMGL